MALLESHVAIDSRSILSESPEKRECFESDWSNNIF